MSETGILSGGCACGGVRYAAEGPPALVYICHCTDCRRLSGSAFNVCAAVRREGFRMTKGTARVFTKRAESGNLKDLHSCPECGSPLVNLPRARPEIAIIRAGTLDAAATLTPSVQIYCDSALPWALLPGDMRRLPKGF